MQGSENRNGFPYRASYADDSADETHAQSRFVPIARETASHRSGYADRSIRKPSGRISVQPDKSLFAVFRSLFVNAFIPVS